MADIDPKKLKRGVLRDVLKQMEKGKDSSTFEKYASTQAEKAREGKGLIGGAIASQKARMEAAKEYAIATKGTLGRRQAFFEGMLGRDLGDLFKKLGLEKMESEERVKEARAKFGLDKKEKKERGAGGVGNLSKPISLILRNVIYVKKMVESIEKSLSKPTIKPGYTFDPRMAGGGRYRDKENKLVSSKEALQTRTENLTTAIGADEQPLVKLKEDFDTKFKDFNPRKVQTDIKDIKNVLALLLLKSGIEIPGRRNVPNPNKPGPNAPKPPGPGGPEVPKGEGKWGKIGKALKTGGRFLGKLSGIAAVGISAYEGYEGYTNAEQNLGLQKGQQATTGQKLASAAGSVVSGLTFGLVDSGKSSRFLAGMEENPMDADLEKYVRKKDAGVNLAGLKPEMKKRLAGLAYEYNQKTGQKIQVNSGYRDSKEQAELYAKFGPPRAAPPGRSRHESGLAVDINSTDADKASQLGLMAKYGFTRPVPGETWHVEPVEVAKKGGTADNPVAPGAPVAVANAGAKPANPGTGTKPPAALTKPTAPAAMTADASTTAPPAAPPPASGLNPTGGTAAPAVAATTPSSSYNDPLATLVAPKIAPVTNMTGIQAAQGSNELESQKMVAQATPPAPVVINNNSGGGGPQKPIEGPKTPLPKAPTRTSESSFARAISNDFSHPTAFTSVGLT